MRYFLSLLFLSISITGFAQRAARHPNLIEQRPQTIEYKDSVQFNAAFAQLYPLIKPTPNVRERAEAMLGRMGPEFRLHGIDSAKAFDTAIKAIDPNLDRAILYDAYRTQFSADELKSLVNFFKTPAGKHYLEVEGSLFSARNALIQEAVARTIYKAIMPMMTKAAENAHTMKTSPLPLSPTPNHSTKP